MNGTITTLLNTSCYIAAKLCNTNWDITSTLGRSLGPYLPNANAFHHWRSNGWSTDVHMMVCRNKENTDTIWLYASAEMSKKIRLQKKKITDWWKITISFMSIPVSKETTSHIEGVSVSVASQTVGSPWQLGPSTAHTLTNTQSSTGSDIMHHWPKYRKRDDSFWRTSGTHRTCTIHQLQVPHPWAHTNTHKHVCILP